MTRKAMVLLALLLAGAGRAEELACTIVSLTRAVEVKKGEGPWAAARIGTRMAPGDMVHTGYKATAKIQFPDASVLELQPMSLVLIRQLQDVDGKVRSRVWLRMGEVRAQVGLPGLRKSDFQIKTATCTASVRGTKIHRVAYTPATGTIVQMGNQGHLRVGAKRGGASLRALDLTQVQDERSVPPTPGEILLEGALADLAPGGMTEEEQQDLLQTGVPKTAPMTQGGSGMAGAVGGLSNTGAHVTILIPKLP